MNKFLKFQNNLLTARAISVLGFGGYLNYLGKFLMNFAEIIKVRDLRPLDRAMGMSIKRFNYQSSSFLFDCNFCDQQLKEDSFAFGIAREVYIRDCYFKWHPDLVYENAKTVVDLGANRGGFSCLMTTKADLIVSVECGEQYVPIIQHNMELNSHQNYRIETAFIGTGGDFASSSPTITMQELFDRYQIKSVDLLKLDIEGSEFSLFDHADWLHSVQAISMEVHPEHGDPGFILKVINDYGFKYAIADDNLQQVQDPKSSSFIYAWK
jgi:Methyltransferase FkbM domain